MTEQAGGSAPKQTLHMWRRRSSSAMAGVAIALGLGGCMPSLPNRLAIDQPGMPQRPARVVPVVVEPDPAAAAAPRLVAVLPRSKPAGHVREQPDAVPPRRPSAAIAATGYLWPVSGRIARAFGTEPNGRRSDGLDITAAEGTPVRAAEAGVVAYAGSEIQGYGNMLLIEHGDGFTTVYAHNRTLLVQVGDAVQRGEMVATVGSSGSMADSRLHFQLRAGNTAIDPAPYLVPVTTVLASVGAGILPGLDGQQ